MSLWIKVKEPLTEAQSDELASLLGKGKSEYSVYLMSHDDEEDEEVDSIFCDEGVTEFGMDVQWKVDKWWRFCHSDVEIITNAVLAAKIEIEDLVAYYFEEDQQLPYARDIYRDNQLVFQEPRVEWEDVMEGQWPVTRVEGVMGLSHLTSTLNMAEHVMNITKSY